MNDRGLSTKDVAPGLHVEEQTVRNWRSNGVPERRQPHVEKFMADWDRAAKESESKPGENLSQQPLVLHPSREQFRLWEKAAYNAGEIHLEDWAINALDQLAQAPGSIETKIHNLSEEQEQQCDEKKVAAGPGSAAISSHGRPPVNESAA